MAGGCLFRKRTVRRGRDEATSLRSPAGPINEPLQSEEKPGPWEFPEGRCSQRALHFGRANKPTAGSEERRRGKVRVGQDARCISLSGSSGLCHRRVKSSILDKNPSCPIPIHLLGHIVAMDVALRLSSRCLPDRFDIGIHIDRRQAGPNRISAMHIW